MCLPPTILSVTGQDRSNRKAAEAEGTNKTRGILYDTRIMVYKKHREILNMPVSNFFQKWLYDCCLFVA